MSTLGEHQGNGIRFDMHLSAPNGGVAQMLCRPEGQWVSWSEYDKLKAEVEAYRSASDEVAAAFLALPTPHNQVARVCEGIESLKAEVERLRKAGDAVCESPYLLESDPAVIAWRAAKEGKQP